MGTYTMYPTTPSGNGQTGFPSIDSLGKVGVWRREFDYAVATTVKGSAIANSDVFNVGLLPYDSLVLAGSLEVVTAVNGSTSTASFGVTTMGTTVFVSAQNVTTAGFVTQAAVASAYQVPSGGKTVVLTVPTAGGAVTGLLLLAIVIADITVVNTPNQQL